MNTLPDDPSTRGCELSVICHCLGVTEAALREALDGYDDVATVKELRKLTGAGDGCTACHRRLRQFIEEHRAQTVPAQSPSSSLPICSLR